VEFFATSVKADMFEDIYEVRRKNLLSLQKEVALDRKDFAEKCGLSYQLLSHYIGKNPTKRIGDTVARRAEYNFGKPTGFLDRQISLFDDMPEMKFQPMLPINGATKSEKKQDRIPRSNEQNASIPVFQWMKAPYLKTGKGLSSAVIIDWLPFDPNCGPNGFGLIVSGESMLPKFEPTDRIYINPDITDAFNTGDFIIVIQDNGVPYASLKRIIVENDGFYIESINPKYPANRNKIESPSWILGKVVAMHRDL
jgi:SOS-response transcriptional repressor LexA